MDILDNDFKDLSSKDSNNGLIQALSTDTALFFDEEIIFKSDLDFSIISKDFIRKWIESYFITQKQKYFLVKALSEKSGFINTDKVSEIWSSIKEEFGDLENNSVFFDVVDKIVNNVKEKGINNIDEMFDYELELYIFSDNINFIKIFLNRITGLFLSEFVNYDKITEGLKGKISNDLKFEHGSVKVSFVKNITDKQILKDLKHSIKGKFVANIDSDGLSNEFCQNFNKFKDGVITENNLFEMLEFLRARFELRISELKIMFLQDFNNTILNILNRSELEYKRKKADAKNRKQKESIIKSNIQEPLTDTLKASLKPIKNASNILKTINENDIKDGFGLLLKNLVLLLCSNINSKPQQDKLKKFVYNKFYFALENNNNPPIEQLFSEFNIVLTKDLNEILESINEFFPDDDEMIEDDDNIEEPTKNEFGPNGNLVFEMPEPQNITFDVIVGLIEKNNLKITNLKHFKKSFEKLFVHVNNRELKRQKLYEKLFFNNINRYRNGYLMYKIDVGTDKLRLRVRDGFVESLMDHLDHDKKMADYVKK